jgi:hypothetical protein
MVEGNGEIIWPGVIYLLASCVRNQPWARLKLPQIKTLDIPGHLSDTGFKEFISSHATLRYLDLRRSHECLPAIVKTPQLSSLSISVESFTVPIKLSHLVSLTLYQTTSRSFPAELFENIVCNLFLRNHGVGNDPYVRQSISLTILVPIKKHFNLQWQQSLPMNTVPLVASEAVEERWNAKYRAYKFRWRQ